MTDTHNPSQALDARHRLVPGSGVVLFNLPLLLSTAAGCADTAHCTVCA